MGVFVITNHRFTDAFRETLIEKTLNASPIPLEGEQLLPDGRVDKKVFNVYSESVNMFDGYFFCTGHFGDKVFRLEEEMGTLYLSVT
ncbi:MAG TPA: hypothetical protein VFM68_03110 [Candidatus Saccharimonadales bacterium]|nr:hypothetical protein [Candidatus Saccharimonadales bacterium]